MYRFIYAIIRLLYYLPMERMRNKDLENAWAVQGIRQEKCAKLEEENKKLKEQLERMKTDAMYDMKDINSLYEENKKLKEKLSKREQGKYRYFGNDGEQDLYED